MNCKVEKTENANEVKLEITVDAEKFENAMKKVYFQNAKYINIPGFRKGKAPMNIVEKYYGAEIFYEDAFNEVATEAYDEAIDTNKIDVVSRPTVDIVQMEKGKDVIFTAVVQVKPEVELGKYKGIEIKKIEYPVKDEDVQNEIKQMQDKNSRLVTVDDRALENGDTATIDFEGFVDGVAFEGGKAEGHELEIGSGAFIPGFEDQLVGMKIDEEKEIKVTFPKEYFSKDLAGKEATFKVKLHEIKKKELPNLDDEFAKDVSEFDTLKELEASIKERLEKDNAQKAKYETEEAAIKAVCDKSKVEIPSGMVDMGVDHMIQDINQRLSYQGMNLDMYMQYTGMTMDALRAQFAEQAKKQLSGSLVLEAIQKAEGIEAGPEEVELELVDMSKKYNMELDKLKELLGDAEKESIKKDLEIQKTITMIVNNAQVK